MNFVYKIMTNHPINQYYKNLLNEIFLYDIKNLVKKL